MIIAGQQEGAELNDENQVNQNRRKKKAAAERADRVLISAISPRISDRVTGGHFSLIDNFLHVTCHARDVSALRVQIDIDHGLQIDVIEFDRPFFHSSASKPTERDA